LDLYNVNLPIMLKNYINTKRLILWCQNMLPTNVSRGSSCINYYEVACKIDIFIWRNEWGTIGKDIYNIFLCTSKVQHISNTVLQHRITLLLYIQSLCKYHYYFYLHIIYICIIILFSTKISSILYMRKLFSFHP
jgi:hypothetical protein